MCASVFLMIRIDENNFTQSAKWLLQFFFLLPFVIKRVDNNIKSSIIVTIHKKKRLTILKASRLCWSLLLGLLIAVFGTNQSSLNCLSLAELLQSAWLATVLGTERVCCNFLVGPLSSLGVPSVFLSFAVEVELDSCLIGPHRLSLVLSAYSGLLSN